MEHGKELSAKLLNFKKYKTERKERDGQYRRNIGEAVREATWIEWLIVTFVVIVVVLGVVRADTNFLLRVFQ